MPTGCHNLKDVIHSYLAAAFLEHGGEIAVGNIRIEIRQTYRNVNNDFELLERFTFNL